MNQKMNFIVEDALEPEAQKEKEFTEYELITKTLDKHYEFKGKLLNVWKEIQNCPEYELKEKEDKTFFIKEFSDRINLAEIDSKEIGLAIITLMNIAYRQGAKKVIDTFKLSKFL